MVFRDLKARSESNKHGTCDVLKDKKSKKIQLWCSEI